MEGGRVCVGKAVGVACDALREGKGEGREQKDNRQARMADGTAAVTTAAMRCNAVAAAAKQRVESSRVESIRNENAVSRAQHGGTFWQAHGAVGAGLAGARRGSWW